jgi:hypothetical protein
MELTFVNDFGATFVIEIDPNMELENVMALLEVEASRRQMITHLLIVHSISCTTHSPEFPLQNKASHMKGEISVIQKPRCENVGWGRTQCCSFDGG